MHDIKDMTWGDWFKIWAKDFCGLAAMICLIGALAYLGVAMTPEVKPV